MTTRREAQNQEPELGQTVEPSGQVKLFVLRDPADPTWRRLGEDPHAKEAAGLMAAYALHGQRCADECIRAFATMGPRYAGLVSQIRRDAADRPAAAGPLAKVLSSPKLAGFDPDDVAVVTWEKLEHRARLWLEGPDEASKRQGAGPDRSGEPPERWLKAVSKQRGNVATDVARALGGRRRARPDNEEEEYGTVRRPVLVSLDAMGEAGYEPPTTDKDPADAAVAASEPSYTARRRGDAFGLARELDWDDRCAAFELVFDAAAERPKPDDPAERRRQQRRLRAAQNLLIARAKEDGLGAW